MKTLTIKVGPARDLAGLIAGMHILAAAIFSLVPVPLWLAASLMPAFIGSACTPCGAMASARCAIR
jgi:hypothetical protein